MSVTHQLPIEGEGFVSTSQYRWKQFGELTTINAIARAAALWKRIHPDGPTWQVGNISKRGGGFLRPHLSHRTGCDVDFRPMRDLGRGEIGGITWRSASYSLVMTQKMVDYLYGNGVVPVRSILFNDRRLFGVVPWPGHDDHLHVRFYLPSYAGRWPTLQYNSAGPMVRALQQRLNIWVRFSETHHSWTPVDGQFGEHVQRLLMQFQNERGLIPDGVCGPVTWGHLFRVGEDA
jgi:murein endopeptidase